MKWWEIPQNCNCLFALDSDSTIDNSTRRLYFSNKVPLNNYINLPGVSLDKVSKVTTSGLQKGLFVHYKALRVDKIILEINTTISIPEETTWILVVKPLSKFSSLASAPNGTGNRGFEFRYDYGGTRQGWTFNSTFVKEPVKQSDLQKFQTGIHKVDISTSRLLKTFKVNTNYGTDIVESSPGSFFSETNSFGNMRELKYLSYNTSTWLPEVDIIAYGAFDKLLTEEELTEIYASIEASYIQSETGIILLKPLSYSRGFNMQIDRVLKNPAYQLKVRENITQRLLKNSSIISLPVRSLQVLYKNLENISDVVLEEGVPVSVKLYLHEKNTGKLIKTTVSSLSGVFNFFNLKAELEYVVTAHDNKYQFQSIIKNYDN